MTTERKEEGGEAVLWVNPADLANERFVGINAAKRGHEAQGKYYTQPLYLHPSPSAVEALARAAKEARDQVERLAGGFIEPDRLIAQVDAALSHPEIAAALLKEQTP